MTRLRRAIAIRGNPFAVLADTRATRSPRWIKRTLRDGQSIVELVDLLFPSQVALHKGKPMNKKLSDVGSMT